jgi:hypothetical protein
MRSIGWSHLSAAGPDGTDCDGFASQWDGIRSQWDDVVPLGFHRNTSWDGVAPIARRRHSLGLRDALTEKPVFRILRKVLQVRICVPKHQCDRNGFLGDWRPIAGFLMKCKSSSVTTL